MSDYYRPDTFNKPFANNSHLLRGKNPGEDGDGEETAYLQSTHALRQIARSVTEMHIAALLNVRVDKARAASAVVMQLREVKDLIYKMAIAERSLSPYLRRIAHNYDAQWLDLQEILDATNDADSLKKLVSIGLMEQGYILSALDEALQKDTAFYDLHAAWRKFINAA